MSERYKIIGGDSDQVESRVNELMAEGWIPTGGVHVERHEHEGYEYVTYSQAMYLPKEEVLKLQRRAQASDPARIARRKAFADLLK